MADFDKMLIMRVLRADRLMSAMSRFVSGVLGSEFVTSQAFDLERSYQVALLAPQMRTIGIETACCGTPAVRSA